ncbi:exported hypothetical protein [uncultured Gammaproteobacteria bacterium]
MAQPLLCTIPQAALALALLGLAAGCTTAETRPTALTINTSPVAYSMPPAPAPPGRVMAGGRVGGTGVMPIGAMGQPALSGPGMMATPGLVPVLYAPAVTTIGTTMMPATTAVAQPGYNGAASIGYGCGGGTIPAGNGCGTGTMSIGYGGAMPIGAGGQGAAGPIPSAPAAVLPVMLPVPTYTAPVYARPNG